jgi:hypothetical protein
MKKNKWLTIAIVLALAVVMIWAVPTLAQVCGQGQRSQGGQAWGCGEGPGQGMGYGPGNANCPYYQGYQNSQGNSSNSPQATMGRRGPRGGGRNYQPNTQTNVPPVTQ